MKHFPKSITATHIFILLNAAFWFGYAILTIAGNNDPTSASYIGKWVFFALALATAAALVILFFLLRKHIHVFYYFGLFLLALIAVLSVTDQVGWLDIFSLLISAIPFVLMLKDRKWYLRVK